MPIEIKWLIPNRIIYAKSSGTVTTADVININKKYEEYLATCIRPFYILSDESETERNDISIAAVKESFAYLKQAEYVISIGRKNIVADFITNILSTLIGYKFKAFNTYQEATAFLKEYDKTLKFE